jgi:hypothetical protein
MTLQDCSKSGWILVDSETGGPLGINKEGDPIVNCPDPKRVALFNTEERANDYARISVRGHYPVIADLVLVYRSQWKG